MVCICCEQVYVDFICRIMCVLVNIEGKPKINIFGGGRCCTGGGGGGGGESITHFIHTSSCCHKDCHYSCVAIFSCCIEWCLYY